MRLKSKFRLLNSLNQTRKQILKQGNSIQNVIDDFRNILSPTQVGKFLLILDKVYEELSNYKYLIYI